MISAPVSFTVGCSSSQRYRTGSMTFEAARNAVAHASLAHRRQPVKAIRQMTAGDTEKLILNLLRDRAALALAHRQPVDRSEEHTSELQSRENLVCRRLL